MLVLTPTVILSLVLAILTHTVACTKNIVYSSNLCITAVLQVILTCIMYILYWLQTLHFAVVFQSRLVTAIQIIAGGHVFAAGLATYLGNETWYEKYLMPMVFRITSPETGHRLAVKAARYGIMPRVKTATHPELVFIVIVLVMRMLTLSKNMSHDVPFSALTLLLDDRKVSQPGRNLCHLLPMCLS